MRQSRSVTEKERSYSSLHNHAHCKESFISLCIFNANLFWTSAFGCLADMSKVCVYGGEDIVLGSLPSTSIK